MNTHEFTLVLSGYEPFDDALANALHEAGCDDATLSQSGGVKRLDFAREAESREEAIASAIIDAENNTLGVRVERVE